MEIKNFENTTNFKAIKLTHNESWTLGRIIRKYQCTKNPQLKTELCDIFAPHIEKEAPLHPDLSPKDFKQSLYLKLLEHFEKLKSKYHQSALLVKRMNKSLRSADDKITMGHLSLKELNPKEKSGLIYEIDSDSLINSAKEKLEYIRFKNPRMKEILLEILDGKSYGELSSKYNISVERVKVIANSGICSVKHQMANKITQKERALNTVKNDKRVQKLIQKISEEDKHIYVLGKKPSTEIV